ncbi:testis-specific Y-encoded-like protein 2 isoform X2 [Ochotona curzoniae]|uniref:testis-specific Y-encoded-like protein 2 isoform X2 n=1 Tax=Ochotona curzoniae TaxID=130825 RepID=UPI001B34F884|nr:testis-specific Y-encoded-like protein 2 isoform X2 [Ochotona curzoniae]
MDRPDEGPPAKTRRLSSSESPERDPPPPPPPPPLVRLPLPPLQQRPWLREETEAAQVLADMRGVGQGPSLPPPPPYVILEEGGVRAYFTLGAGGPDWEPAIESGYGEGPPPMGSLETLPPSEASGGSVQIDVHVAEPSSLAGEKALETCSTGVWGSKRLIGPKRKEEAVIIVEDEDESESLRRRRRRRRRRKQRKMKKASKERNGDGERMASILQALESIQMDLEAVNIKAGKAFLRLKRKFIQMRRPFLERRDLIIQHIPGFWVKAFLNHPRISVLINQRDEDIFRYLTNLQVQDLRHISMGYKMKLYFQTNPYFTNTVIVKEFQRSRSGRLVCHSTPIRWHRGQEPQAQGRRNQDASHSFFNWFSSHSLPEADRIAEIIKNDLWVNPVRYYMMKEGGYRTNRKKQERKERKAKRNFEVVIMEDGHDFFAVENVFSEISDIDDSTDNETVHDIKTSDFMETTDYFESTDNEIADAHDSLCDSESPIPPEAIKHVSSDSSESTDDSESADDNSDHPENKNTDDTKNLSQDFYDNQYTAGYSSLRGVYPSSLGHNQDSSESDNEASDDEDNDGNEGDNEGSDDDGNEGDNEGSDDDDRDIEYYRRAIDDFDKNQHNSIHQEDYEDEVEIISEDSVEEDEEEEEEGNEEGGVSYEEQQSFEDDEGGEMHSEDSDVEEMPRLANMWGHLGKRGKTG